MFAVSIALLLVRSIAKSLSLGSVVVRRCNPLKSDRLKTRGMSLSQTRSNYSLKRTAASSCGKLQLLAAAAA